MNPTKTPKNPGDAKTSVRGPQTSHEAKPEQKTKIDNDRDSGSESSQAEKERRSNLAGDQDVDDGDDTRSLP